MEPSVACSLGGLCCLRPPSGRWLPLRSRFGAAFFSAVFACRQNNTAFRADTGKFTDAGRVQRTAGACMMQLQQVTAPAA